MDYIIQKKIFKYRWMSMLLLLFFSMGLTSCSLVNRVEPNESRIILQMNEDVRVLYDYEESMIPDFIWEFEGIVYTNVAVRNAYEVVLAGNDDFTISDLIEQLIEQYRLEPHRFSTAILSVDRQTETRMNSMEIVDGEKVYQRHILRVENNEVFNEIAYITLENGLHLTIQYRRFVTKANDGEFKTYYAWQYSSSIRMVLHFPSMVIETATKERKFVLLPIYNKTLYTIGVDKNLANMLQKDTYFLDDSYRTFYYPNYSGAIGATPIDKEQEITLVKEYYSLYFSGREEQDGYIVEYLGNVFQVDFNDYSYTISYLHRVQE